MLKDKGENEPPGHKICWRNVLVMVWSVNGSIYFIESHQRRVEVACSLLPSSHAHVDSRFNLQTFLHSLCHFRCISRSSQGLGLKVHLDVFLGRTSWCDVHLSFYLSLSLSFSCFLSLPLSLPLVVNPTVSEAEHWPEPTGQVRFHTGLCPLRHAEERGVQDRWGRRGAHVPVWPRGVQVH